MQFPGWQFADAIPNVMVARAKFDHGIQFWTTMDGCQRAMRLIRLKPNTPSHWLSATPRHNSAAADAIQDIHGLSHA